VSPAAHLARRTFRPSRLSALSRSTRHAASDYVE
jgi:hypothetical protein